MSRSLRTHTRTHIHTTQQPKEARRTLLLKWSKLPGVKERLLLKKDRERRGREKEGEALRIEDFSGEKAKSDSSAVGSQSEWERSARGRVSLRHNNGELR